MSRTQQALDILQEECAEVVVAISKQRRFPDAPNPSTGLSGREQIIQEIGDVMALVDILVRESFMRPGDIYVARDRKIAKLREFAPELFA